MKKIILFLFVGLLGAGVFFTIDSVRRDDRLNGDVVDGSFSYAYPAVWNKRQSSVECGPYSVAAVSRIATGEDIDSNQLYKDARWKIPGIGVHPRGLMAQLHDLGIQYTTPDVRELPFDTKLWVIQQQLNESGPVILLGQTDGFQHYITVLGYNNDAWYVYDSLQERADSMLTIDENGENPGNVTYTDQELLAFWYGGGVFGFFEWFMIATEI